MFIVNNKTITIIYLSVFELKFGKPSLQNGRARADALGFAGEIEETFRLSPPESPVELTLIQPRFHNHVALARLATEAVSGGCEPEPANGEAVGMERGVDARELVVQLLSASKVVSVRTNVF